MLNPKDAGAYSSQAVVQDAMKNVRILGMDEDLESGDGEAKVEYEIDYSGGTTHSS